MSGAIVEVMAMRTPRSRLPVLSVTALAAIAIATTGVALVFYYAPDADQDWVWITPGSIVTTVLWVLFSMGFRLYVTKVGDYAATYGALAGAAILLLWLYFSGLALLIGLATRPKAEATTGENAAAAAPPAAHETPAAIVAPTQLPHQPSPWTQALDEDDDELFDDVELVVAQSSGGRR